MESRNNPRRVRRAAEDLRQTITGWRLGIALGGNDIMQRYRRSSIGQFWITLSMATFIITIGSIYSLLFRSEINGHLPYVAIFYITWSFISSTVNEGCNAFMEAERYLRQEGLPKLTFVLRVVWRNALAYLHNWVLVPVTLLVFGIVPPAQALAALAGLAFLLVNVTLVVIIVATLCTRFRDLRQVVQSVVQMLFFASPIMWQPENLPAQGRLLVDLNPVAAHLQLIGNPLLGTAQTPFMYAVCAASTGLLLLIAVPLFVRFRERIVYWL